MSIVEALEAMDRPHNANGQAQAHAVEEVQVSFAACGLHFSPWWGITKALTKEQKERAAQVFGAKAGRFKGGKTLIDIKHPTWAALVRVKNQAREYWINNSLPWPEDGIRLIRRDQLQEIRAKLDRFAQELRECTEAFENARADHLQWAEEDLKDLFNLADYPATWLGTFGMSVDYPNVLAPDYLRQLDPEAYERERLRVAARFDEAVKMAEEAFIGEFSEMVSHLVDRMTPGPDGKAKVFKDATIDNLADFFDRFRNLNIRSNPQLDQLVATAQQAIHGVRPDWLRDSGELRRSIGEKMGAVQAQLDGLMVDKPRRNLIRRPAADQADQV